LGIIKALRERVDDVGGVLVLVLKLGQLAVEDRTVMDARRRRSGSGATSRQCRS